MKKKIAILGSTGSIGKNLLNIIEKDKKEFDIILLSSNTNYKDLLLQAKKFNVKNLIITNKKSYSILKKKTKGTNFKIYNSFDNLNLIIKKKLDYVMSAITGIDGLSPTVNIIKHTKVIAIANKESIICGWYFILKELKKNKTIFVPVDSEHFSLWYALRNIKSEKIEQIFLTASGGPLYKVPIKKFNSVDIQQATNHPRWKMGKKISIDSATMMNKVYEAIEAKNIFDLPYEKIKILIHPNSYIHALIKFTNGLIKIIAHDTTMKIPIFNTIYLDNEKKIKTQKIKIKTLNSLYFDEINLKKYPMIKLLNYLPNKYSLFETVVVSANDTFVELFLDKKIKFVDIQKRFFRVIKNKKFTKYKKIYPKNLEDIVNLNNYVRLKILSNSI